MANENIIEVTPMITPDTVRATLRTLDKFNETHTKRYHGYEDINGSKYVGTAENFGDEILVESRKMLMDKPSLKRLFDVNTFGEYFDIAYSELTSAYTQQNMLVALLKNDVLLDKYTYYIRFKQCKEVEIIRSSQDGDTVVEPTDVNPIIPYETLYKDKFYATTTPPELVKVEKDTNSTTTTELVLDYEFDAATSKYFFHLDTETADYDIEVEEGTIYGTMVTVPLISIHAELPHVWIVNDLFADKALFKFAKTNSKMLNVYSNPEPGTMTEWNQSCNEMMNNISLEIVFGNDSQGNVIAYPKVNFNFPYEKDEDGKFVKNASGLYHDIKKNQYVSNSILDSCHYVLRVYSNYDQNQLSENYDVQIGFMRLYLFDYMFGHSTYVPVGYIEYAYDVNDMSLCIFKNKYWSLNKRYTGSSPFGNYTYETKDLELVTMNRTYPGLPEWVGEITKDTTYLNYYSLEITNPYGPNDALVQSKYYSYEDDIKAIVFKVKFNDAYYPFEGDRGENVSGLHVDAGTDYTNHSVVKDHGIIHELDQFSGLPSYFNYLKERTIHRSHVEVYSIRDRLNRINQKTYEKQTAALILDSAVPQSEIKEVADNTPIVIYYNSTAKKYDTKMDQVISKTNSLSEITFTDPYTFSNSRMLDHNEEQKFVYHGNRTFSLGLMEYDPELEKGRVYAVTNDPATYVNNGNELKPARTLARICDIPTDYSQLMHVPNTAPTLVFDKQYTHSGAACTVDVLNRLWNEISPQTPIHVEYDAYNLSPDWIVHISDVQTMAVWHTEYDMIPIYAYTENLDAKVNISDATVTIANGGSNYEINDEFYLIIGGTPVDGVVTAISNDGKVMGVTFGSNIKISPSNFPGRISTYHARNTKSDAGSGLEIMLTFSVAYWESLNRYKDPSRYVGDVRGYAYDPYNNIWLWKYDRPTNTWSKAVQVTGDAVVDYPYDISNNINRRYRDVTDVMLYNLFNYNNGINPVYAEDPGLYRTYTQTPMTFETGYNPLTDISEMLTDNNIESGYYTLAPGSTTLDGKLYAFNYLSPIYNSKLSNMIMLPRFNQLNVNKAVNKSNKFFVDETAGIQPSLYLFMPNRKYNSIISDEYNVGGGYYPITKRPITFDDVLYVEEGSSDRTWIDTNGITTSNIYRYNEFAVPRKYSEAVYNASILPRSTIDTIYENTYGVDISDLPDDYAKTLYITNRYISTKDVYYGRNEISKMMDINIQVVSYVKGEPVPETTAQPSGAFVNVSQNELDIKATINGSTVFAPPLYIFEIDYTSEDIDADLRIYDENNKDISDVSMLVRANKNITTSGIVYERFICRTDGMNNRKWIKIN